MNSPKSNRKCFVLKSKSSNSAMRKQEKSSKKNVSRSNGEMPMKNGTKKRGIYVEEQHKRPPRSPIRKRTTSPPVPPPRPKSGAKTFINSALNLLCKSSTATQYPEMHCTKIGTQSSPTCLRKTGAFDAPVSNLSAAENTNRKTESQYKQHRVKINKTPSIINRRKNDFAPKKFRSVVLRGIYNNDRADDRRPLLVLQDKRDIVATPSSMYSENTIECPSDDHQSQQDIVKDSIKNIMERNNFNMVKDEAFEETNNQLNETDKSLYNFFADALKNSVSVYNVEEVTNANRKPSVVRFDLERNNETVNDDTCCSHTTLHNTFEIFEEDDQVNKSYQVKEKRPHVPQQKPKRKVLPKVRSHDEHKIKKRDKITLLNLLREQLSMDFTYDEPTNIYEALKRMAKNKKKQARNLQFHEPQQNGCQFKRDQVLSDRPPATRRRRNETFFDKYKSLRSASRNVKKQHGVDDADFAPRFNESYHSLEVYGMDYESSSNYDEKAQKVMLMMDQTKKFYT